MHETETRKKCKMENFDDHEMNEFSSLTTNNLLQDIKTSSIDHRGNNFTKYNQNLTQQHRRTRRRHITTSPINIIIDKKNHDYISYEYFLNNIIICIFATLLIINQGSLAAQSSPELPTVIVRGFLNYRTTVDGTVLLFTPDATSATSPSTQTNIQPTSISASSSFPQISSSSNNPIEPTSSSGLAREIFSTELASTSSTTEKTAVQVISDTTQNRPTIGTTSQSGSSSNEELSPVSESSNRARHEEPPNWYSSPTPPLDSSTSSSYWNRQISTDSSRSSSSSQSPSIVTITNDDSPPNVDPSLDRKYTPSVQSEDIILGQSEPDNSNQFVNNPRQHQSQQQADQHTIAGKSSTPSWLAKRPPRGSLKPATSPNGGGPKKPTSISSSSPSSLTSTDPNTAANYNSRLANASAKLRNRFKKPPIGIAGREPSNKRFNIGSTSTTTTTTTTTTESPAASSHDGDKNGPVVGSDDVLSAATSSQSKPNNNKPEQTDSGSMELTKGQIANSAPPMSFENFFGSDQGASSSSSAPASETSGSGEPGLTDQAATGSSNQSKVGIISPSFASNIPTSTSSAASISPNANNSTTTIITSADSADSAAAAAGSISMQTITKTYSTIMTSLKTRLVPLQVKSSTSVHTITEQYVITKMMTAYQTMPVGEFLLPETQFSSRAAPFEIFNTDNKTTSNSELAAASEQPISAPQDIVAPAPVFSPGQQVAPEQAISKSPNDWLHDFTSSQDALTNALLNSDPSGQSSSDSTAAINNLLAGMQTGNEPLDQLASSLDPAGLLAAAGGNNPLTSDLSSINIPDLNNPLVLAAAIQNPQLAAVILAAQQLQLKQRADKTTGQQQQAANLNLIGQRLLQQQQQQVLQAPSYSTTYSTVIKPTIQTVRDTMYTTRLVSFKDGRTVRTRTVSEPGTVIEQLVTTMATEVTPVTITIRPTAALGVPLATQALSSMPGSLQSSNNNPQQTLKNALLATQLAQLLARRQQQVQLMPSQASFGGSGGAGIQSATNPSSNNNQLALIQQFLANQQQQKVQQQQATKFQPNFQQLLASMQQQQQQQQQFQQQQVTSPASTPTSSTRPQSQNQQQQQQSPSNQQQQQQQQVASSNLQSTPTPPPPCIPPVSTLTSLHVRTYTVHNAFKTIFRTITSTELITSTIGQPLQLQTTAKHHLNG